MFVTVEMEDGRMFIGELEGIDEDRFKVVTHLPGRNPVLWYDDVVSIEVVHHGRRDLEFL